MVRTKARANIAFSCFSSPSDSGNSSEDEVQVEMGKKANTHRTLPELRVKDVPEKKVPCTPDDMWTYKKVHFITKAAAIQNTSIIGT